MPDLAFGVAVEVWPRTARAICSASKRSDLPSIRRARRFGRLTSMTRTSAVVRNLLRVAPNDPVLSTPTAATTPWLVIQSSNWA
jgi:hypothetical protein